jgi:hypothetical protein
MLDMNVHRDELKQHLIVNNISPDQEAYELVKWVENFGKSFREYLNTVKYIWSVHIMTKGVDAPFTYEEFKQLKENYHIVKDVLEGLYD